MLVLEYLVCSRLVQYYYESMTFSSYTNLIVVCRNLKFSIMTYDSHS